MEYLEINNLKKKYGDFELNVDFSVREGEFLSLIGPSGSGKSTVLSILTGLEEADEGMIVLDGEDITRKSTQERNIGLVFQDYALFSNMNVEKNIQYGMDKKHKSSKEIREQTDLLLEYVDLVGYGNGDPVHLYVELAAVRRDGVQAAEDHAAYRIIILVLRNLHVQRFRQLVDEDAAGHAPQIIAQLLHLRGFRRIELVVNVSDDLLQQVLNGDDARRLAVLVDHDGNMDLLGLHVAEQIVRMDALRHKIRCS